MANSCGSVFKCPPRNRAPKLRSPVSRGLENPIFRDLLDFDARHCVRRNGQQLVKDYQELLEAKKKWTGGEWMLLGLKEWDWVCLIMCFMDVHGFYMFL